MLGITRTASCHPERPYLAKGLCQACYQYKRVERATCHVDRPRFTSDGLCRRCYRQKARVKVKSEAYARTYHRQHAARLIAQKVSRKRSSSPEQYQTQWDRQGGVCAICRKVNAHSNRKDGQPTALAQDHNHETNASRGLLCALCNRGLGLFLDNPTLLREAASYLEVYDAKNGDLVNSTR